VQSWERASAASARSGPRLARAARLRRR
jgi:hypothetical protein